MVNGASGHFYHECGALKGQTFSFLCDEKQDEHGGFQKVRITSNSPSPDDSLVSHGASGGRLAFPD